jgi:hypothetical protein
MNIRFTVARVVLQNMGKWTSFLYFFENYFNRLIRFSVPFKTPEHEPFQPRSMSMTLEGSPIAYLSRFLSKEGAGSKIN